MKLHIVGQEEEKVGGGWSWINNAKKCWQLYSVEEADTFLITSVSMLGKLSEIPRGKKIVLRVDNVLKKSTNRDIYGLKGDKISRMEAMKEIAQFADVTIYQSEWAKDYLNPFLKAKNPQVVLNATDETVFNDEGGKIPVQGEKIYLYSRSSNHDNKGWHKAYYEYQYIHRTEKNAHLWLIGRFSSENIPNNFDFFNGERVTYLGHMDDPEAMATYYRSADTLIYPYSYDACSNTLIESLLCHCNVIYLDLSGGAAEIKEKYEKFGDKYFYLERMKNEYEQAIKNC
jgi:glycosyltransferase involved in cell wall biosynthesis